MRAGKLRHSITIQQQSTTQDSYGQQVETWTNVATVWASVEPLRGKEYFESKQEKAEVTTKITMRYRDGILPKMRVVFGSKTYDIQDVINLEERDRELHLMCLELVS